MNKRGSPAGGGAAWGYGERTLLFARTDGLEEGSGVSFPSDDDASGAADSRRTNGSWTECLDQVPAAIWTTDADLRILTMAGSIRADLSPRARRTDRPHGAGDVGRTRFSGAAGGSLSPSARRTIGVLSVGRSETADSEPFGGPPRCDGSRGRGDGRCPGDWRIDRDGRRIPSVVRKQSVADVGLRCRVVAVSGGQPGGDQPVWLFARRVSPHDDCGFVERAWPRLAKQISADRRPGHRLGRSLATSPQRRQPARRGNFSRRIERRSTAGTARPGPRRDPTDCRSRRIGREQTSATFAVRVARDGSGLLGFGRQHCRHERHVFGNRGAHPRRSRAGSRPLAADCATAAGGFGGGGNFERHGAPDDPSPISPTGRHHDLGVGRGRRVARPWRRNGLCDRHHAAHPVGSAAAALAENGSDRSHCRRHFPRLQQLVDRHLGLCRELAAAARHLGRNPSRRAGDSAGGRSRRGGDAPTVGVRPQANAGSRRLCG